jgi:hypothetical protein
MAPVAVAVAMDPMAFQALPSTNDPKKIATFNAPYF